MYTRIARPGRSPSSEHHRVGVDGMGVVIMVATGGTGIVTGVAAVM